MARANKKPAGGGGNPAAAPKAPAADPVVQGNQTGVEGETLTGPATDAGAGAPEGVIASSGGSATVEASEIVDLKAALAGAEERAANADERAKAAIAEVVARMQDDIDHLKTALTLAEERAALAEGVAKSIAEEALASSAVVPREGDPFNFVDDLVEISARSKDGKPFRRGGVAWTGDFKAVSVSADLAERIRTDPNLVVKG